MNEERNIYTKTKGAVKVSWLNRVIVFGLILMTIVIIYLASTTKGLQINFETYGGSPVPQQHVMFGEKVTEPPAPELNGKTFAGWYTTEKFQVPWDFENQAVENSMTLYGKFE